MRIAIVAPPWTPVPPPLYGGIEQAIDAEALALKKAGHEVLLCTTGDSTCPVPIQWYLPQAEGYRIGVTVPELRHVAAAYDFITEGPERFDIIHDHTVLGPFYAERFGPLPLVTTVHGPFNDELRDLYLRLSARVPLIGISKAQHTSAPEIPLARIIHHGIDAGRFPVGTGHGDVAGDYVLFLGRLAPEKGAKRAIEAARKAGVRILLAGKAREPHELACLNDEIMPLLGDDVLYLGEVAHEEKLRLLAGARCTLFPIRWNEPFGLVMIESMACGTPVLAFNEGAAPEVVDHGRTGYLCEDEVDMAERIAGIDSISRASCRAAAEGYFSVERMAAEHISLFTEIAGRS
ncbi:MAG: glycosyltransferase family 4 protein [Pseudonocardiaceae bacterium]